MLQSSHWTTITKAERRTTNTLNEARLDAAGKGLLAAGQEFSSQMLSGMLTKSLTMLCFERECK